ncbi:hypothetical protein SprV_0501766800 [Sparganum proliferum]
MDDHQSATQGERPGPLLAPYITDCPSTTLSFKIMADTEAGNPMRSTSAYSSDTLAGDSDGRRIVCPFCSLSVNSDSDFMRHVGNEHEESLFASCKTCDQCFTVSEIAAHVQTCKGSFVCLYCRQTFALPAYLKRHIRRKHSVTTRYPCKFCDKTYSSSHSLNGHIQTHLKHRSKLCNMCGASLVLESDFHLGASEDSVEVEGPVCHACGHRNKQLASRKRNGSSCTESDSSCSSGGGGGGGVKNCPKDILDYSQSEVASIFHQAAKLPPYNCPYCQRMYVSLTCFRKHIASHAPSLNPRSQNPLSSESGPDFEDQLTAELCDLFTEQEWMDLESYPDLPSPNLGFLQSIFCEGKSADLL